MKNPPITSGRTIGVRSSSWRATVTPYGTVVPHDGSAQLAWAVAADDRWYEPAMEPSTRQKWYAGYPVAETRVHVPTGDIVQRVYCVADLGGITVVEFENESGMPVVVAVTRNDVLTTQPQNAQPPMGIDMPAGSITLPVGHKSTTRIGILHAHTEAGRLPDDIPNHQQVVRGWEAACDVASRIGLADHTVVARVSAVRSNLLLSPQGASGAEVIELVRLGETNHDSIVQVVNVVQKRLKEEKRAKVLQWDTQHLLATAARACVLLGEDDAASDIGAAWLRIADRPVAELPLEIPEGIAAVAWIESLLAGPSPSGGVCTVLPYGIPETWLGSPFEAHGLVADAHRTLGYAVRWHGARPALLWEVNGAPGLVLTGGAADADWNTTAASGETLLAAPVRSEA